MIFGRLVFTAALALVLGLTGKAAAEDKLPEQLYCPVSGSPVDREVHTDYEGSRVYFCCEHCIDAFKAEPAKYLKKLDKQKKELQVKMPQSICPVSGKPINRKYVLQEQGHYIYFCCGQCIDLFKKDPAAYVKKMEAQGVEFENAPDWTRYHLGASEGMPKTQKP